MNKITKLCVTVLAVALLVCAAVGIGASANTVGPAIISQNVEYGGNYALMYAVAADSVSETVTLEVYDNAECAGESLWSKTIEAVEANQQTIQGVKCYVFTTCGIAAKDMDVQYYAKAISENGETVKRYSVAEYLYERLYKNGIAFSEDAGDMKRAELYNSVLAYGKLAQEVLYNYDSNPDNDIDTFVTDMKYVYVDGGMGTVDGSFSSGIFAKGSSVTLAKTDASTTGYYLYDATNGKEIGFAVIGSSFTVNTHVKAVATDTNRGTGKYADYAVSYDDTTLDALYASGKLVQTHRGIPSTKKLTISDNALNYSSTGSSWSSLDFAAEDTGAYNYVLDTDIKIVGANMGKDRASYFIGSSTTDGSADGKIYGYRLSIYSNPDTAVGGYVLTIKGNVVEGSASEVVIPEDEWTNIRYEVDSIQTGAKATLYVNGSVAIQTTLDQSISGIKNVGFMHQSTSGGVSGFNSGTISLDNTYVGNKKYDDNNRGTGEYKDYAMSFDGKTIDELKADGTITAYATGATLDVSKINGNDALKLYANASNNWGRYSITGATGESYVFEADMLFDNIKTNDVRFFSIWGAADVAAEAKVYQFNLTLLPGENEGEYVLKACDGTYVITQGEWMNVRIEADSTTKGSATRFVVNGQVIAESTLSVDITLAGMQLMAYSTYNGNTGFVGNVYIDNVYLGEKK